MAPSLSTEEARSFLTSKRHLLSTPSVVSLGFIDEKVDGKKTGGKIFRVGVIKKLGKEDITHPDIFIPKFFEHTSKRRNGIVTIPVDVVEEGELVFSHGNENKKRNSPPPYKGGSLIITADLNLQGCLGANAQYKGSYRLLSAAHVLTAFDRYYVGKKVLVENEEGDYVEIGATVTDQVDVVLYDTPNEPSPVYAKQDLAWANITEQEGSPEIEEIGLPSNIRKVVANELVKYYAGKTGDLGSEVQVEDTMAMTKIRTKTSSGSTKYAYFEDVCRTASFQCFMAPGDSGTAIVAESDNALLGITMSASSSSGTCYFSKLEL